MSLLPVVVTLVMPMWFEFGLFSFFHLEKLSHDAIRLLWGHLACSHLPLHLLFAPFMLRVWPHLTCVWDQRVMHWFRMRAGAKAEENNSLTFSYGPLGAAETHMHQWDIEAVGSCKKLSRWGRTTIATNVFGLRLKKKTEIKYPSWLYRNNQTEMSLIILNYSSISQLAGSLVWSLEGYQSLY